MHKWIYFVVAFLILTCSAAMAGDENRERQTGTHAVNGIEIIGGDENSLRYYLARSTGRGMSNDSLTSIFIGQLPDDIPFDIPLPEKTSVVGSVVRQNGLYIDIILDSELKQNELIDFFAASLSNDNWQPGVQNFSPGGFQPFPMTSTYIRRNEAVLNISISELANEKVSSLRINIQTDPGQALYLERRGINQMGFMQTDPYYHVPYLIPLQGVSVQSIGGGGGGGPLSSPKNAFQSAILKTEISLFDIAEHYINQLSDNYSWNLTDSLVKENISWSSWTFTDDSDQIWGGMLIITSSQIRDNEFTAMIQVFN